MIGLLSLVNAENYGAVLQSLALCNYINREFDNAEVIDYTPPFIVGRYKCVVCCGKTKVEKICSLLHSFRLLPITILKKIRFYRFRRKNIKMSKTRYIAEIKDDKYSKYIVGSDQIWNLELTRYDETFFLSFVDDNDKKYSYAASVGVNKISNESEILFNKYLKDFRKVSVREKTAVNLIRKYALEKEIKNHIDPVFLLDKDEWRKYASRRTKKGEYVLIYTFVDFYKALKVARRTGFKIYSIHNSYKGTIKDVTSVPAVGPSEFISLIMNARYVVTDSFHGMAFSILFEKEFTVIPYKKTESRMLDLLEDLGLEDRVYSDCYEPQKEIDYVNVKNVIKKKITEANEYIEGVIYDECSYNAN